MLQIKNISKSFGNVKALDDVSLMLADDEFVSFLGPSGCGKTTLLRVIAGLETPDGGEVQIDQQTLVGPGIFIAPEHRHFGMVFQSYALWPHMTVNDNLAFPLEIARVPGAERKARILAMLDSLDLAGLGERRPAQLSGGQQQRVALGRALITKPRALLLDEPLSNVDARVRQEMRLEIRRVQRAAGLAAIYVTHDQSEALALSDRVVVMNKGQIEQVGTPEDIYRWPRTDYVARFMGSNILEGVVTAARGGQMRITVWDLGIELDVAGDSEPGEAVRFAIQPAMVKVVKKGTPDTGTATVLISSYLGERVEVELAAGKLRMSGTLGPGMSWPASGDVVGVELAPESLSLIGAPHLSIKRITSARDRGTTATQEVIA